MDSPQLFTHLNTAQHWSMRQHTLTWLSSPPVASLYAWLAKFLSWAGRAFLNTTGWKSQVDIGLLSCQRISSVLTRIVIVAYEYREGSSGEGK